MNEEIELRAIEDVVESEGETEVAPRRTRSRRTLALRAHLGLVILLIARSLDPSR